jgi:predicted nucleotidyltransferase
LPQRVQNYLDAIANVCTRDGHGLVAILLFGSAAKGGFADQVSDVDLIVVLPDGVSAEDRRQVRAKVSRLEIEHGFKEVVGRRSARVAMTSLASSARAVICFQPVWRGFST